MRAVIVGRFPNLTRDRPEVLPRVVPCDDTDRAVLDASRFLDVEVQNLNPGVISSKFRGTQGPRGI